jgi:hypothetical protein
MRSEMLPRYPLTSAKDHERPLFAVREKEGNLEKEAHKVDIAVHNYRAEQRSSHCEQAHFAE